MPLPTAEQLDRAYANLNAINEVANGGVTDIIETPDGVEVNSLAKVMFELASYNERGLWVTSTAYALKDLVIKDGIFYICTIAHTSGTFSSDYTALKWRLFQTTDAFAGSPTLTAMADLTMETNQFIYFTDAETAEVADLTAFSLDFLTSSNAAAAITKLGLAALYQLRSEKGVANGYASLDSDGLIPSAQIPQIAITDTYVVASQVAMLALSDAEQGDVAVRSDLNKTFILKGASYSTLADWQELPTPTDTVLSVNGDVGVVVLNFADVGAQEEDETLSALAGLTTAADTMIYATAPDVFTTTALTSFARTILDDTDGSAVRTTIGAGDASGPASSVDNTLPRFNGTGGKTLKTTGIVIGDDDAISGHRLESVDISSTTHTLQDADCGKNHRFTHASGCTVTVPETLDHKWQGLLTQMGAGQVTIAAGGAAVVHNAQTHTKTRAQYSALSLWVDSNSGGSSAVAIFQGDTAA